MKLYKIDSSKMDFWDMIEENLREEKRAIKEASFWDVVDWWIETYPDDIFINDPPEVIKIRELMLEIKKKKKP